MEQLLVAFANMIETGYQATIAVLFVLAARVILQWIRVPRKYIYLLWLIPFFRLLVPFQIESDLSIMPKEAPAVILEMKEEADSYEGPVILDRISYEMRDYGEIASNHAAFEFMEKEENANMGWLMMAASVIWILGIVVLALYSVISYIRFRHNLATAVLENEQENIYLADHIFSPFVLCGRKCAIYLPSGMKDTMKEYVISHEKEHIRRKDPVFKLIAFAICLVHWMNPFAWLAYYYLGRDMELACDEAVIRNQDAEYRKAYAKALLFMSVGKVNLGAVPLAFAEGDPRDRVEKIAAYRKSAIWAAGLGILCVGILAVGLLSDPKSGKIGTATNDSTEYLAESDLQALTVKVNLKGSTGNEMTRLYYVDEDRIIFGGYFGLFVFSKEEAKITASVDLEKLGWDVIQGEGACEIKASADGKYVYFAPDKDRNNYAYDCETRKIYSIEKNWNQLDFFENLNEEGTGATFVKNGETVHFQLREGESRMIGDLTYREYNLNDEKEITVDKYRHLFLEGRYKNVESFEPEDIEAIIMAEMVIQGEIKSITDRKILSWVEESLTITQSLDGGGVCPYYDPLYLTRKDGSVGVIYPATDICSTFRTENGEYYDYRIGSSSEGEEAYSYFKEWLSALTPGDYWEGTDEDAEYVDGAWIFNGKSYRYRMEVRGRLPNAAGDTVYTIVTNNKDITFEELFPFSGLSSHYPANVPETDLISVDLAADEE